MDPEPLFASKVNNFEEMTKESTMEHRKHQRYPVRFKSIYSTDGIHIEDGLVLDLSLGGCRLASPLHVPYGTPVEIHIRPDQHAPVYVSSAIVCWGKNSHSGLAFEKLSELEVATLTRLLWSLSASQKDG